MKEASSNPEDPAAGLEQNIREAGQKAMKSLMDELKQGADAASQPESKQEPDEGNQPGGEN